MSNKFIVICFSLLCGWTSLSAQDCNLNISGRVVDEGPNTPLSYVNVLIQELNIGTMTEEDGSFVLEKVCPGAYHMIFSHIGCEPIERHVHFYKDSVLLIALEHTPISLDDIIVQGKKDASNQPVLSVNRQRIEDNANQNLSGLLENEAGVHLIKNGNGIAKPIVHGLYGNRLTILNNGVAQSGQQWGNDHSPEIDPLSADKITVVKGANAIEYGGGNLGSVILVEPKKIKAEPHLHGQINYVFDSNGRGHGWNTRIQKHTPMLAWRINATLKKSGDKKTPTYFLNNTGGQEANFSLQLEKQWQEKLFVDFYASTFNTTLGILRGSHVGNLTDLEQALDQETPFFTETAFSYQIEAPKQAVAHHLVKIQAKYFEDDSQSLQLMLAGQQNKREEFDVRRSGRTDTPALSLNQYTLNAELKYLKDFENNWKLKIGSQSVLTDNTNNPETGILPLIPDYISWKTGLFTTLYKSLDRWNVNVGFRYDYEGQNVATISQSIPREIIRYDNHFHNIGTALGLKFDLSDKQSLTFHAGYATRNPGINELYSNGLHQGVSGIEEGDVDLQTEKAIKNTLEYKWLPSAHLTVNVLGYFQRFQDYIYLNPQDEIRLTIRGAFPVFQYEQTDATIYGLDISTQFMLGKDFFGLFKYSFLQGKDTKNAIPLVYMPPNSCFGSLTYRSSQPVHISSKLELEQLELEVNNRIVFNQNQLLATQDFVAPPPTYQLIGLKLSANLIFPKYKFRAFVKVDNLLNIRYRDYLNRQRYFADDVGRNATIGMRFKF